MPGIGAKKPTTTPFTWNVPVFFDCTTPRYVYGPEAKLLRSRLMMKLSFLEGLMETVSRLALSIRKKSKPGSPVCYNFVEPRKILASWVSSPIS